MDYLNEFLLKVIPINILELFAAIAGTYYLRKQPDTPLVNKYLVYFLWYTFINELIAAYAPIAYFSNYEYFSFVKETAFRDNVWLYNIYTIVSFSFFGYYFKYFLYNRKDKRIINFIVLLYLVTSIVYLFYNKIFFKTDSNFSIIAGSFLLLYSIFKFYFNLLKSDIIIDLKNHLPIYISIGVLVFNLCITPLVIFNDFFNSENDIFVLIRTNVLLIANLFMYPTFIIGFLVCAKKGTKRVVLN